METTRWVPVRNDKSKKPGFVIARWHRSQPGEIFAEVIATESYRSLKRAMAAADNLNREEAERESTESMAGRRKAQEKTD